MGRQFLAYADDVNAGVENINTIITLHSLSRWVRLRPLPLAPLLNLHSFQVCEVREHRFALLCRSLGTLLQEVHLREYCFYEILENWVDELHFIDKLMLKLQEKNEFPPDERCKLHTLQHEAAEMSVYIQLSNCGVSRRNALHTWRQ
jgi:hypothetical protein